MSWIHRIFQRKLGSVKTFGDDISYDELYGFSNETGKMAVELACKTDHSYIARFTFMNKNKPEHSFRFVGVIENVDPDGLASFTEFDPEHIGNPTQFFKTETEDIIFNLYKPYDNASVIGIDVSFKKGNPANLRTISESLWKLTTKG